MATVTNDFLGLICIIVGMAIIIVSLGSFLLRICMGLVALSIINYGLRLRGLPPLQILLSRMAQRRRFF